MIDLMASIYAQGYKATSWMLNFGSVDVVWCCLPLSEATVTQIFYFIAQFFQLGR
jgi:hypothetical protein